MLLKQMTAAALAAALSLFLSGSVTAAAEEHYDVYHYDCWSEAVPSQAGYTAERAVSGQDLGVGNFSEPTDIFRDSHDRFYIVDSGNDRIVVTDAELETVEKVFDTFTMPDGSETALNSPQGVYVAPETELLYIADYDNSRVLISDYDGNVQREITKPDSELFSQELTFLPQKVLADKAGNVYIVLGNITTGAAMFSSDGVFQGYYGANTVQTTPEVIVNHFRKLLSTDEMRSRQARTVPSGITNFDLDDEGFIYTCSQSTSQTQDTVKKLNAAGANLFSSLGVTWGDIRSYYDTNTNTNYQPMICDIEISDDKSINCLDLTTGRVFQYDKEGSLLFIFGSKSDQLGGFTEVTALESCGESIYVVDKRKNTVTVFAETDFGSLVHKATELYNAGYYEEALAPWYQVLQYDGNYVRAYEGIASGLLVKGDYEGSMRYAKLADSNSRYNKAFEGYRQEWLSAHFTQVAIVVILVAAVLTGLHFYRKKHIAKTETAERSEQP